MADLDLLRSRTDPELGTEDEVGRARSARGLPLTAFPEIAKEWDVNANGGTRPEDIAAGSGKKGWWWCRHCGHRWEANIGNRTRLGRGCPRCANRYVDETNSLATTHPTLAIEWHPTQNNLTPNEVVAGSNKLAWWECLSCGTSWQAVIASRAVNGNGCPGPCKSAKLSEANSLPPKGKSLEEIHPDIAAELDPDRNNGLQAALLYPGSSRLVWWRCATSGHQWQTTVYRRVLSKRGCPDCAKSRPSATYNLAVTHPDLAREWHPDLNGDVRPSDITFGSEFAAWWRCPKGHVWQAAVGNRARLGVGCQLCGWKRGALLRKTPPPGRSLGELYPELAKEWHPTRNGNLLPEMINPGCEDYVWWLCVCGHSWRIKPSHRTQRGSGCPACANKAVTQYNSLAALRPDLAVEWHRTKNGHVTPKQVVPGAEVRVWWKCESGHEWEALVYSRSSGTGCPVCVNQVATPHNSLATLRPDLAAEWHAGKNHPLTPDRVVPGSGAKVWWRCDNGHEWEAVVGSRHRGSGCPHCRVFPRSRTEIRLACELAAVIGFDIRHHRVAGVTSGGSCVWLDCDIVIPELMTVVEFDGAYWHKDRAARDLQKTADLHRAGYWCIRVREAPLKPICPIDWGVDIVVTGMESVHSVAVLVLRQIVRHHPEHSSAVQDYILSGVPWAADLAEVEIRRISF